MGLLTASSPLVDHKYSAKWADRQFDNVTSQRWRDAVPV